MSGGLREGTAAEAGLSVQRLDRVRELAAGFVADGVHHAVVALVARRGVIALHEAFGRLGPEADAPALTREALFPIASLTKPVTATALMMLVEEGRVGLTRPVREYLPEFAGPGRSEVFVHHLLTHTSGIEGPTPGSDEFVEFATGSVGEMLRVAYERPLRTRPGEDMFYDTANYELLGEIIRRVSGIPLEDFFRDRIFGPLGMTDSYLVVPAGAAGRIVRAKVDGLMEFAWKMSHDVPRAGAGVHATARDLAVFGQAFLDGRRGASTTLLTSATMLAMTTNQIPGVPGALLTERHDEASWGYGWGIACEEKWSYFPTLPPGAFSHSGATGALLWCDPSHDLVGVFLAPMNVDLESGSVSWHADLFANAATAAVDT